MKKFVIKVVLFVVIIGVASGTFCYAVDPYNVFHPGIIVDNGVEPNKNYLKMKNVLEHSDWFDGYLFGSSRVGSIHVENIGEERIYNMTYSEGTPYEHLENIKTMVKNGIIPKKIYMGVDSISYTCDPESHKSEGIRAPYELYDSNPYEFFKLYLDPAVIVKSAGIVLSYKNEIEDHQSWVYNFYHYGWTVGYGEGTLNDHMAYPVLGKCYRYNETLSEIKEIVNICNDNNIELVVFTNPMYYLTYEASLGVNYLNFLNDLAEITPFYNFSGYSYISTDPKKYNDPSHFTSEVGDIMIDIMVYNADLEFYFDLGFGYYTTSNNVDELIRRLETSRDVYLKEERWP